MEEKIDMNDILNNNTFNESETNNLGDKNSKKLKLLYDEEPEIVSYGKSSATDIGDFVYSFIEHLWTSCGKMSNQIRECSMQYTNPLIPDLTDQQISNSLYRRNIIPINFPPSSDYKDLGGSILYLLQHKDPKFTDDTFFDKNAYKSCLEHDEEYKLSQDRNQYEIGRAHV